MARIPPKLMVEFLFVVLQGFGNKRTQATRKHMKGFPP